MASFEEDDVVSPEDEEKLKGIVEQMIEKGKVMSHKQAARNTNKFASDAPVFKTNLNKQRHMEGHHGKIYALQWASDSRHLLTAAQDGKLFLWDAHTAAKDVVFKLDSQFIMCCAINAPQRLVVCGGLDNIVSVFDVNEAKKDALAAAKNFSSGKDRKLEAKTAVKTTLQGHDGYVSCVKFVQDDQILSSSGDQTVIRWDLGAERKVQTYHGHLEDVSSVELVNEQVFVTGSVDNTVKVWDIRVDTPVMTLYGHTAEVHTVTTTGGLDGMIASCSDNNEDGSIRVWDYRAKAQLINFQSDASTTADAEKKSGLFVGSSALAFTKSGRGLVAGFNDGNVRVFDVLTGLTAQTLLSDKTKFGSARISAVGVSPDGMAVAVASWQTQYGPATSGPGPVIFA